MKQISILVFCIIFFSCSSNIPKECIQNQINIIPNPTSISIEEGYFILDNKTKISASCHESLPIAEILAEEIKSSLGYELQVYPKVLPRSKKSIIFKIDTSLVIRECVENESYKIQVSSKQIIITAKHPSGLFYGTQTLIQLMDSDFFSTIERHKSIALDTTKSYIPCVEIIDNPRFKWRGLMLDVSRHFFSKIFVKKLINEMAKYKFNTFHLHLSDDQGWRIEIKSLPKLTEIGAWRVPRTGKWWSFVPPYPGEESTYGGFFTQDDIKEIVQYASDRFITVVPEIDIPGHSLAAIASYPELSCTKEKYHVNPGSRFYGIDNNTLCAGQELTFDFVKKIIAEIVDLFPSDYIHIGGDECFKGFWGECDSCSKCMKDNNLTNVDELQSYFIKRVSFILKEKGRKLIGWDEIHEDELDPEAIVMNWRGTEGEKNNTLKRHQVIMTPTNHTYLDFYQGDPLIEPETYSSLRLERCYNFELVPQDMDKKIILGGQGNLWTESVPNERHAEYMIWPRALALSEVFWSAKENRDWNDFIRRMEVRFNYFNKNDIKFSKAVFDPIISAMKGENELLKVKLRTEIPQLEIHYTFDETNPDENSPKYNGFPLDIPCGASQIKVRTFRSNQPIGKQINCPLNLLNARIEE